MEEKARAGEPRQPTVAEMLEAALESAKEVVTNLNEAFKGRNGPSATQGPLPSSCPSSDRSP
jgi:hypothetical protein